MPVVTYTVLRLVLFLLATGALWWVGLRSWLAPLAGLLVAWGLSYVLLARQSAAAARYVEERSATRGARRPTRADEDAAYEDAVDDADRRDRPDR